jgi:aminopeptidase-like protein
VSSDARTPALPDDAGEQMLELARAIFPLPRSLTGNAVRATLEAVGRWARLEISEVPSGSGVYDWIVPPEWNVREAYIADDSGARLVDLAESSLHVVGYSEPVRASFSGAELDPHLHSLPDRPHAIPYRTSYFERTWGFCLAHESRVMIDPARRYEVVIDSTLDEAGSLTFGEARVAGTAGDRDLLVSTYVCHPSLANDNVAGIVVAAALARWLEPGALEHDVRVVFSPSGVGTLAWLARNEERLDRIDGGLVVACAGDNGPPTYKRSRRGEEAVDRAAALTVRSRGGSVREFVPWGTDERQFCSPGFDLPVGVLTRTPNGLYDAYHTSDDDLSVISAANLLDTLEGLVEILTSIDRNRVLVRTDGRGEPQLSRHAVDATMTAGLLVGADKEREALFWTLNLADGRHDLLTIAARAGVPFAAVDRIARSLEASGLLREAAGG